MFGQPLLMSHIAETELKRLHSITNSLVLYKKQPHEF